MISTQRISDNIKMAERIKKIPIPVANLTLDSHAHIYTNFRPIANKALDKGPRTLDWLTERVISNAINALGITNFEDWNYEFWTSPEQLKNLPRNWRYYQDSRLTVILPPTETPAFYLKSQEIPTQQGHILLSGGERGVNLPSHLTLDATLGLAAKDSHLRKVADHLNSVYGLKENILGKEHRFDSYEFNAQADEKGNQKTINQAHYNRIPLEASSDSHNYSQIGKSNIAIQTSLLSFESGEELVDSINKAIKTNNFNLHMEYSPKIFSIEHLAKNGIYHFILKRKYPDLVDPNFGKPE